MRSSGVLNRVLVLVVGVVVVHLTMLASGVLAAQAADTRTTVVRLRSSATLVAKDGADSVAARPITLMDVADVDGPNADALRSVIITEDLRRLPVAGPGVVSVGLTAVRSALDSAGVHWGRTVLSGSVCEVRHDWPTESRSVRLERAERAAPQVVDVSGEMTVRKAIALRIASHLDVEPTGLRLLIRAADASALDRPTGSWRIDVEAGASAASARLPVRVFAYEGDRLAMSQTADVEVLIERGVLVAAKDISRGDSIASDSFRSEHRWLSPAQASQAVLELGGDPAPVASSRIREGTLLTREMMQAPIAAKRGDTVWVHCLSGSVRIKAKARAMESIRDGEVGLFRLEGSQETFRARMSGSGRAVMVVGEQRRGAEHGIEEPMVRAGESR